jgi:hypothetical protein
MRTALIPFMLSLLFTLASCSDDNDSIISDLEISNLRYSPESFALNKYPQLHITGQVDYRNAIGGLSEIRITTSAGSKLVLDVGEFNSENGTVTGMFAFTNPGTAGTFTFDVLLIDKKGRASSSLRGFIELFLDDTGTSWQAIRINSVREFTRIERIDSRYFATGTAGVIISSQDGRAWQEHITPTSNTLHGITWNGSRFAAVGNHETILSSPDGNDWTLQHENAGSFNVLKDVVWTGERFVAVGYDFYDGHSLIMTSTDGINWDSNEYTFEKAELSAVATTIAQIVVVGKVHKEGMYYPFVLSSINGIDWYERSVEGRGTLDDIIWTGHMFAAVGIGVSSTSSNGMSWSSKVHPSLSLSGITFSGNTFLAVGDGVYTSSDAQDWQKVFSTDGLYPLTSVAWSGYQYTAVGPVQTVLISP